MGINRYKYLDLIMAAFVTVLVLSNVASSAKIVDLHISLFNVPLAFDGGTILFPISYIFGDILTEVYGFKASRRVIWAGFAALALSCVVFFLLKMLPGEASWQEYAGDAAYEAILGGLCSGALWLASLSAYLAGEFSNSMLLSRLKVLMKGRLLFVRTIGSTLVGELLDSLIFIGIATLLGVFDKSLFLSLVITNYILKCAFEIVMTPATYAAAAALKRKEGIDTFDKW
ncbi:MAG: queuosine precursor transporter [Termitinemataceae bacterium]|nr:MAG: queuosine precursor transporter [Termitinemataceae bacterium]